MEKILVGVLLHSRWCAYPIAAIKLMRPHHWIKNIFMFVPLFFAGEFFNIEKIEEIIFGFVAFSLTASSIYIINDLRDFDMDKLHPLKSKRPLTSGEISKPFAISLFVLLIGIAMGIGLALELKFLFILLLYFLLNLCYSFGLKDISIVDVIIVAIGFILRVKAGGALSNTYVTEWLIVMIFLLALFLAFAKRRDDLLISKNLGLNVRKTTSGYNLEFLTTVMTLVLSALLISYLIYCLSVGTKEKFGTHRLYYTFLFVLMGIFRYLQIIFIEGNSGCPTSIFYKDRLIQACILLWVLSFSLIIYYPDFTFFN